MRREEIQRRCARKRIASQWRSQPKALRESLVKSEMRDAFVERVQQDFGDIEEQAGKWVHVAAISAAAVGVGVVLYKMNRCLGKLSDNMDSVTGSVEEAVTAVTTLTGSVGEAMTSVSTLSQEAVKPVSGFNKAVDMVMTTIGNFVDTVKKMASGFWEMIFAVLCWTVMTAADLGGCVRDLFMSAIGHFSPRVAEVFESTKSSVSGSGISEQAGDGLGLVGYLSALFCTILVPGDKSVTWRVGEIMKRVSNFERAASGFSAIFEGGLGICEKVINCVLGMVSTKAVTLVGGMQKEVNAWAERVDGLQRLNSVSNPSLDDLIEAQQVLQQGFNLKNIVRAAPLRQTIDRYLDRINGIIAPHRGMLENQQSFRQAPVFVMLGGESAVGKTTLLAHLSAMALLSSGEVTQENVMAHMWQKGTSEYWNGYCAQKCYVMDDCMQEHAVAGQRETEAIQIIRAVGSWPYPLNFADLDSKGRWYFVSKLIVGTTNVRNISQAVEGIVRCPQAVTRRVDYGYWMEVAPAFATESGTLDYAKFTKVKEERMKVLLEKFEAEESVTNEDVMNAFPWEAWILRPHRFDGAMPSDPVESTLATAQRIGAALKERSSRHEEETQTMRRWLKMLDSKKIVEQVGSGPSRTPRARLNHLDMIWLEAPVPSSPIGVAMFPVEHHSDSDSTLSSREPPEISEDVLDWPTASDSPRIPEEGAPRMRNRRADAMLYPGLASDGGHTLESTDDFHRELRRQQERRTCVGFMNQLFDDMFNWVYKACHTLSGWIKCLPPYIRSAFGDGLTVVTMAGLGCATILTLGCVIRRVFGFIRGLGASIYEGLLGKPEEQSVHHRQDPLEKHHPRKRSPKNAFPSISEQLGNPPDERVNNIVYENGYHMSMPHVAMGVVTFISDTLFVMPKHFLGVLEQTDSELVTLRSVAQHRFVYEIPRTMLLQSKKVEVDGSDIVYVRLPFGAIRSHRNIIGHMLSEQHLALVYNKINTPVRLDVTRHSCDDDKVKLTRTVFHSTTVRYQEEIVMSRAACANVFAYEAQTIAGDCGAPLTIAEPRYYGGSCFLGIHVAAKVNVLQRTGYAAILSRESATHAMKILGAVNDRLVEDLAKRGVQLEPCPAEEQAGTADGSALHIGVVDQPVFSANKTQLYAIHPPSGIMPPCERYPARLRPFPKDGETIYPMRKAMANYFTPVLCKPVPNHRAVMAMAMQKHWEVTANCATDVLTFEQAITGIEGRGLKAINMRSSAGYPARLLYERKRDMFCGDEGIDFTKEEVIALRDRVEEIIAAARNGERLAHVFTDFLKDELRAKEKVDNGESRAISGSPVDYVVVCRMYFGAFLAACHETFVDSGMAPGINPYSDWHKLAEKLGFGKAPVFAGDFKRFDAAQQPLILSYILEYINSWYLRGATLEEMDSVKADNEIRNILFMDLLHSRHLTGESHELRHLVQWNKSLPSGHPLTTVVNSMFSLFTLTACYVDLTGDLKGMWDKVYLCTYGDDNVARVHATLIEVFNQVTVAEAMMRLFNLTYTSDVKGAELTPSQPFEAISFLKRKFQKADVDGGWVAPLDVNSIFSSLHWLKDKKDPVGQLTVNVHGASTELALHGEKQWTEWAVGARDWLQANNITLTHTCYEHALAEACARNPDWF
jgi:hypothetical protein